MRLTYKAIRVVEPTRENPTGRIEVEFKVNDNDTSNVYIRRVAEAAMGKATRWDKVHGWSPVLDEANFDRPMPRIIA